MNDAMEQAMTKMSAAGRLTAAQFRLLGVLLGPAEGRGRRRHGMNKHIRDLKRELAKKVIK